MNFAHDGLHDGLTRLAAPPYYYEILRREIAFTNRNLTDLTAIRVILKSKMPLHEATVIAFADSLSTSFRYEDVKARLGEYEFGIPRTQQFITLLLNMQKGSQPSALSID